jgi:hypothetical protein
VRELLTDISLTTIPLIGFLFFFVALFMIVGKGIYDVYARSFGGPSMFAFILDRIRPTRGNEGRQHSLSGKLCDVFFTYTSFAIVYIFTGILSLVFVQAFAGLGLQLQPQQIQATVKGFLIAGILAAIMTRIFALHYTTSVIKTFYFQLTVTLGAISVAGYYGDINQLLNTTILVFRGFPSNFAVQIIVSFLILIFLTEFLVLMPTARTVSFDLLRERINSVIKVDQVLLSGDIRDTVLKELEDLDRKEHIREIRWITGSGYTDIVNWIVQLDREPGVDHDYKIITTKTVGERWFSGTGLGDLWSKVIQVENSSLTQCRMLIVDRRAALFGIPIGSDYSTIACKVTDSWVVNNLVMVFDHLYNSLKLSHTQRLGG